MAGFVDRNETQEIHADWWGEDEVVVIRRFGYLDRKAIQQAAVTILPGSNGHQVAEVDSEALDRELMLRGIVSWTLVDGRGKKVPFTRSAIERLDEPDGEFITNAIAAFNPRRTPEQQASFRGAAGGGAEGGPAPG